MEATGSLCPAFLQLVLSAGLLGATHLAGRLPPSPLPPSPQPLSNHCLVWFHSEVASRDRGHNGEATSPVLQELTVYVRICSTPGTHQSVSSGRQDS